MGRSLRASAEGLKLAKAAFKRKGRTQEYLAGAVGCTRQTVSNFFAQRPVDTAIFQAICTELGLEWGAIAELDPDEERPKNPGLDELVKTVRGKIHNSIQKRCGTMRVLDMEQPIGLNAIYTTVNILEKVTRNQRLSIDELLKGCNLEDFDRFTLSGVQQEQVPGLEAVKRHDKLLILGKPGAGKTTFLKWLAIQCNAGKLHSDRVPIFVTLKEFAEAPGKPTLLNYISDQLQECDVNDVEAARTLLREGRSLVLLDGLDEVRDVGHDRVLQEIRSVSDQFDASQFVMTCRIAAKEYTFERFTEVEVADFNDEQIAEFSRKWFQPKDPVKAEEFPKELKANRSLKDLATNPLLLTLLCLVFAERAGFPANRSELYKEGIDVLLKKWDAKRNIKRDEVYKDLSLQRKEDLLSQIAYTTFEQSEYFFKQKAVEQRITQYIRNLPNANTDAEALQLDSEAVLKSIEAQHGLLVERARGIYSFSHLTFQEFLTARRIEKHDELLQTLVSHITEKRWREVFLLTIGMLENADLLLKLMKDQVDALLIGDSKLQQFLTWVDQKSHSVNAPYKLAAIRAFYFNLDLDLDFARVLTRALDSALALDHFRALDNEYAHGLDDSDYTCDLDHFRALDFDRILNLVFNRNYALEYALECARANLDCELQCKLQQLKEQLQDYENSASFQQWWQSNGQTWITQLRTVTIEHRNIGHDWQFSDDQKKLLQQYYDANKLLVDCLNSDCYVSREVREEIEGSLLLPVKEGGRGAGGAGKE